MTILHQSLEALVIEDNSELAAMMVNTLMLMDIIPVHARNTEEAMALLDERRPDLILFDLDLPNTTSWELVGLLQERYEIMPALLTTTYRNRHYHTSFRIKHLMASIERVLDRQLIPA